MSSAVEMIGGRSHMKEAKFSPSKAAMTLMGITTIILASFALL